VTCEQGRISLQQQQPVNCQTHDFLPWTSRRLQTIPRSDLQPNEGRTRPSSEGAGSSAGICTDNSYEYCNNNTNNNTYYEFPSSELPKAAASKRSPSLSMIGWTLSSGFSRSIWRRSPASRRHMYSSYSYQVAPDRRSGVTSPIAKTRGRTSYPQFTGRSVSRHLIANINSAAVPRNRCAVACASRIHSTDIKDVSCYSTLTKKVS
jgi:hypothetical protein